MRPLFDLLSSCSGLLKHAAATTRPPSRGHPDTVASSAGSTPHGRQSPWPERRCFQDQLGTSTDIEIDLRDFARWHVELVTQPHLVEMRRMIIAEAHRFPDLARAWHRSSPERGHATLASQIDKLVARGQLQLADSLLAAQLLNYLILSVPLNEATFTGRDKPYSRRYLNRYADEAVRVFLAAYGSGRRAHRLR